MAQPDCVASIWPVFGDLRSAARSTATWQQQPAHHAQASSRPPPLPAPEHASWERNEAAKVALGPEFTTWTWQGIVEMVPPGLALPLYIEPLGTVDKETPPWLASS